MSDPEHAESARAWLVLGDSDLRSARVLLQATPPEPAIVCFHSQQAAEKYLKAFLVFSGIEPPYTHDLTALLSICSERDASMRALSEAAALLRPFAVHIRYPGAGDPPDSDTASLSLHSAETICDAVRSRLSQLR